MGNLTTKQWNLIIGTTPLVALSFLITTAFYATLLIVVGIIIIVDATLFGLNHPVREREKTVKQKTVGLSFVATVISMAIFIALAYLHIIPVQLHSIIVLFYICLLFPPFFQMILRFLTGNSLNQ